MSMIFLAQGIVTLGRTKRDKDGNIVESTSARFTWNDTGGSIAIGYMDPETKEIDEESVSIFGDWDAAGYLATALELLKPTRPINIPDLVSIIQAAIKDGVDVCDYCQSLNCRDCAVKEWKEDAE